MASYDVYRSLGAVSDKIAQLSALPIQTGNCQGDVRGTVLEKSCKSRSLARSLGAWRVRCPVSVVCGPSVARASRRPAGRESTFLRGWSRQTSLCVVFAPISAKTRQNLAVRGLCVYRVLASLFVSVFTLNPDLDPSNLAVCGVWEECVLAYAKGKVECNKSTPLANWNTTTKNKSDYWFIIILCCCYVYIYIYIEREREIETMALFQASDFSGFSDSYVVPSGVSDPLFTGSVYLNW